MVRFIFKWLFRVVLLLVVLVVLALVFKDAIARVVLEHRIRAETGMETHIGKTSFALLSPTITIEDLKMYNTAEFGGGTFLDVPELHVEYDRGALMDGKFHITLFRLNVAELDIVKNGGGITNVTSISDVKTKLRHLFPRSGRAKKESDFVGIDVLNLSVGKIRMIDLKDPAQNRDINVNLKDEVVNSLRTEDDFNAALGVIWLKHGAEMGISLEDVLSGFGKKHAKKAKGQPTNATPVAPVH